MRNYVKHQKIKMISSISEQMFRNDFNFFREFEDPNQNKAEDEEDESEEDYRQEEGSDDNNNTMNKNLYGQNNNDLTDKNVIIDDDIEEYQ